MALMALTSRMSALLIHRQVVSRVLPCSPVRHGIGAALRRLRSTKAKPVPADAPLDDEFDEGEYDPIADLTAPQRRRVFALKDVQAKYDVIGKDYMKEWALLQSKYEALYAPLFDERKAIVSADKAVDKYDIPDDGEQDGELPEFWATALSNHDKVGPYITERDNEVLAFLEDIRSQVLTGEDRGFKLSFHFKPNPFFTNKVLEKTYILQPEEEIVPKQFIGCKIDWKEGKDVTVEQVKKRVKAAKGDKGDKSKSKAFVMETVPCDSFFNIFDPPQIPEDTDSLADENIDELQEELNIDFEVGYSIKDNVIPRAVEWFTGEIAPLGDGDYDEYDEEEGMEEDLPPPPPPRKK